MTLRVAQLSLAKLLAGLITSPPSLSFQKGRFSPCPPPRSCFFFLLPLCVRHPVRSAFCPYVLGRFAVPVCMRIPESQKSWHLSRMQELSEPRFFPFSSGLPRRLPLCKGLCVYLQPLFLSVSAFHLTRLFPIAQGFFCSDASLMVALALPCACSRGLECYSSVWSVDRPTKLK